MKKKKKSEATPRPQKVKKEKKPKKERKPLSPDAAVHQLLPIVFVALAALFGVCIYTRGDMGIVGNAVSALFRGLFGGGAYLPLPQRKAARYPPLLPRFDKRGYRRRRACRPFRRNRLPSQCSFGCARAGCGGIFTLLPSLPLPR